jgi:cytochrome b561
MRPTRYNHLAIALHWVLALGLLYELALGLWMMDIPKSPPGVRAEWFNWHKSVGMSLGLLIVLRGLWRLHSGAPALPQALPGWQQSLAKINHAVLYACMVLTPLCGFLGSSFSPYPIKFFGIALPKFWAASPQLKEFMSTVHYGAGRLLMLAIALHLAAAVWHALRRDGVVARMLPGRSV